MDVSSEAASELRLNEGGIVFLRMPRENLIKYPNAAAV
jgi:hypothetical protein